MDRRWLTLFAFGAVSLALTAVGCGEDGDAPGSDNEDDDGSWTIDDARAFDEFQLYWVGSEYAGLPLTDIIRYRYEGGASTENSVSFLYGDCDPASGPFDEGGCALPLTLRIEPYCDKPPELFSAISGLDTDIRGAIARTSEGASHATIWTGDVTIGISATQEGGAMDAVEALRPIMDDDSDELGQLPSPRSEPCAYPPPTPF